jgi:hypothetical protein
MSTITIPEPGMTFGPFEDNGCYHLEKCAAYKAIMPDGIKMAEFLLIQDRGGKPHLWIVEAKSSSPHPNNSTRFTDYVGELASKLTNGLSLGIATYLKRHPAAANEIPQRLRDLDFESASIRLIVVVNQDYDLDPITSALTFKLRPIIKTLALGGNSVVVLNVKAAQRQGLITNDSTGQSSTEADWTARIIADAGPNTSMDIQ